MSYLLTSIAGVALDRLFGEAERFHPLVGFGKIADDLEQRLNREKYNDRERMVRGAISLALLVLPFSVLAAIISSFGVVGVFFDIFIIYLAIGAYSLEQHALTVFEALDSDDIEQARHAVSMLVSRDTSEMQEEDIARATVESVLENGCDAVFGALFWFSIAGAAGAVMYRLTNTLDAMWGYKSQRFLFFGRVAARFDDLLNFVPARLTALTYALLGSFQTAITCWRTQAPQWKSPNAGPVMAAGAGALSLQLGGDARYHGANEFRPALGAGETPSKSDILRANQLVRRGIYLWLAVFIVLWSIL